MIGRTVWRRNKLHTRTKAVGTQTPTTRQRALMQAKNAGPAATGTDTPARRPASPGRTLSLRADPRGAPSDMLSDHQLRQVTMAPALAPPSAHVPFCAEWRAHATRRNIALRACPAPSPRLGPILMRVCRSLPPVRKRQARERAARTHGWLAAASPARPACGADCANLPARSAATRHSYAARPASTPAFPGQSFALSRLWAHSRTNADARDWREKTEDWQVKTGRGRPIPHIWGQHVH